MLSANGLNVYILYFNMAATQNFFVAIWLVPVSLGQPCFVLVWSGSIRSQEKCIQKWISAALVIKLTEEVPGACLAGRLPSQLKLEGLKFWLPCHGDSCKGLKTKTGFVKR